ncbi:MAG: 50S ribosomal protein L13 [Actinomycetota bacterium]|nr:50S ribosomal protein L13 [Actinomycetota bacterium]
MKTYSAKPADIKREWHVIDATGVPLGRLASEVAVLLRGKHKPIFTPHMDTGDYVIVINAERVKLTGNKLAGKMYHRHTGYIGSLKSVSYEVLMKTKPEFVIKKAVKGMIPHNSLGRDVLKKLKVKAGPNHEHEAQKPKPYKLKYVEGDVSVG